jgi:hypothetical protein
MGHGDLTSPPLSTSSLRWIAQRSSIYSFSTTLLASLQLDTLIMGLSPISPLSIACDIAAGHLCDGPSPTTCDLHSLWVSGAHGGSGENSVFEFGPLFGHFLSSSFPLLGIWTLGSWPLLASIGFKDLTPSQPFLFAILLLSIYFTLVFHIEESVFHIEKSFCMHFILYISIYSMFDRNKRNMLLYVIEHIMSRNHCDGSSDKGKSKRDFEVSMEMTEKTLEKSN